MMQLEWQKLEQTIRSLSAAEKERLRSLLNQSSTLEPKTRDPLLGLMSEEPDLIDSVMEAVYAAREQDPLRMTPAMQKTLLDTDTFSEILKGKNPSVLRNAATYRLEFGVYTLSVITIMEVVNGFQRVGREDQIESLLTGLVSEEVLTFDREASVLAGRIYGELHRAGQPIGRADPMIAALAILKNLVLATGNTRHYERVCHLGFPLSLQNWRS